MKTKILSWLAVLLILQTGLLHLMTAQAEYEEAAYLGYLFIGNFLAALLAAYGVYRQRRWGWALGLFIAVISIAAYTWSRTQGMPGMEVEEWFSPFGVVALSVEGIFILLFIFRAWNNPTAAVAVPAVAVTEKREGEHTGSPLRVGAAPLMPQPRFRYALPLAGVIILAAISTFAYRWDANVKQAYGIHVISLDQALRTPESSLTELEEHYGVKVSLVATSMMDSIVDVRLTILDPDKAHLLLQNQAALLVDQQSLVLAPHMHSHIGSRLKAGKTYIIFFPTQKIIHSGSMISLVFGPERVEPIVVR
jgi:hypothetical protein